MRLLENLGSPQIDLGFDWNLLAPVLIILGGAACGILLEAFVGRQARWATQCVWSFTVIISALLWVSYSLVYFPLDRGVSLVRGELIVDSLAMFAQFVLLIIGVLALMPMVDRTGLRESAFAGQPANIPGSYHESQTENEGYQRSEVLPLMLFSLGGMMIFPMANSFLTLFVALEVISLPLYVMTATARYRRLLSQEAAMKYFILGAYASAFFLMGTVLLYGYSGSLKMDSIALAIPYDLSSSVLLVTAILLVLVGLLFKVGVAPFHAWTPDVYQGAPTPVTGFMAAGVKVAAFLALLRFYALLAVQVNMQVKPFLWAVALLTMLVGTIFGLVQENVKRMLAYSSIAHAGFIMIALVPQASNPVGAMLFYLFSYGVATVGAFAVIYLARSSDGQGNATAEAHNLTAWAGLGKRNPILASAMFIFLISFAGIPLTAGFVGKFLVFSAGIEGGAVMLVVAAVASSAMTAFFYFRLAKIMFLDTPTENTATVVPGYISWFCIGICVSLTLLLGILPSSLLEIMQNAVIVVP